jgi:hypothetical protein
MLAVYAPYGADDTLSAYPEGQTRSVLDHPLIDALRRVARTGVPVVALIDRVQDDTWLVEITPEDPDGVRLVSKWKQDMRDGRSLASFLLEAHERHPQAAMVLGLEGHGSGYVPDLDYHLHDQSIDAADTESIWRVSGRDAAPFQGDHPALPGGFPSTPGGFPSTPGGFPSTPGGFPSTPGGFPSTPGGFPSTPASLMPMATAQLGLALARAQQQGCPKIAVVHLAGCFNMSIELLHALAPYADVAVGFCNYNFFTAGAAYASGFQALAQHNNASALQLGQMLCDANHEALTAQDGHPTVGGVVALERMKDIALKVDALADEMLNLLRNQTPERRAAVQGLIEQAIVEAQNYDTDLPLSLEAPDQLTDLCSLAAALARGAENHAALRKAAKDLQAALADIKRYGDRGVPWTDDSQSVVWDFTEATLAMNIFLPDPLREGLWDWRSPYYFDVNPKPTEVRLANGDTRTVYPVQASVIDFLKETNWVEFLKEYHRDTPFNAFHLCQRPKAPVHRPGFRAPQQAAAALVAATTRRPRVKRSLGPVAMQVQAAREAAIKKD